MGQGVQYGLPFLGMLAVLAGASCRSAPSLLFRLVVVAGCAGGILASADPWNRVPAPLKWQLSMMATATVLALGLRRFARSEMARGTSYRQQWHGRRLATLVAIPIMLGVVGLGSTIGALRFRHRLQDRMFGGIVRFVDEDLPQKARLGFWGQYPPMFSTASNFAVRCASSSSSMHVARKTSCVLLRRRGSTRSLLALVSWRGHGPHCRRGRSWPSQDILNGFKVKTSRVTWSCIDCERTRT